MHLRPDFKKPDFERKRNEGDNEKTDTGRAAPCCRIVSRCLFLRREGGVVRVYLDNCCYNRPFDDQSQLRIKLEALAKMQVQERMRNGELEYVWSDTLTLEVTASPYTDRKNRIIWWMLGAAVNVENTSELVERGRQLQAYGLKPKDALHLASAEASGCDFFLTTDSGIYRKVQCLGEMRVLNPVEFAVMRGDDD